MTEKLTLPTRIGSRPRATAVDPHQQPVVEREVVTHG